MFFPCRLQPARIQLLRSATEISGAEGFQIQGDPQIALGLDSLHHRLSQSGLGQTFPFLGAQLDSGKVSMMTNPVVPKTLAAKDVLRVRHLTQFGFRHFIEVGNPASQASSGGAIPDRQASRASKLTDVLFDQPRFLERGPDIEATRSVGSGPMVGAVAEVTAVEQGLKTIGAGDALHKPE